MVCKLTAYCRRAGQPGDGFSQRVVDVARVAMLLGFSLVSSASRMADLASTDSPWIPLPRAVLMAHMQLAGADATLTPSERDRLALVLSQLLTIYSLREADRTAEALTRRDLEDGRFAGGASRLEFIDGRPSKGHLVVSRTSLGAALALLKRSAKGLRGF